MSDITETNSVHWAGKSLTTSDKRIDKRLSYHWHCIDGHTELKVSIAELAERLTMGENELSTDYHQGNAQKSNAQKGNAQKGKAHKTLLAAKQLRTQCFSESFGVTFYEGLDTDAYDEACLHLVITEGQHLIATARLLDSSRAARIGGFYSENEFYLPAWIKHYPYNILEVGRTCIHPDYRNGKVLRLLWQAIAEVAKALDVNAFMGCCSIPIGAGDVNGWLKRETQLRKLPIKPKYHLPASLLSADLSVKTTSGFNDGIHALEPTATLKAGLKIAPLLHSYIKMGASVSEQACFDVDFHCADILVWLPFEQVQPRYQHLL